jgi:diketogulonate reductase-like aldo/keto reductase
MEMSRRDMLRASVGVGAAVWIRELPAWIQQSSQRTRVIPSTGEAIPVVGLGSARTFEFGVTSSALLPLKEVLRLFHEMGGRLFDSSPSYRGAEEVAGALAQELEIHKDLFFATKISTGGDRQEGIRQQEGSKRAWGRDTIDLNQVHNLRGTATHLQTIRQAKEEGWTRYVGITTSGSRQFDEMARLMRSEPIDFVQLNYSLAERQAADRLLPLAQDLGIAVVVNEPFNIGRLFSAVRGHKLPRWAAEFDCESWGQFFLKYLIGHPVITAVVPATSDPEHLVDNMGAGLGRLPDERTRKRMEDFFDGLD